MKINSKKIYPKISVLMTVYNHQKFLRYSIGSILNQTYKKWELIVIDNGSTDKSKIQLLKFKDKRIKKFYLKKNIGRTKCLNYGLRLCKGKYIAILDSDDIAYPNRLQDQIITFNKFKDLYLVSSNYHLIDEKNKIISKNHMNYNNVNLRKLLHTNIIAHSSVMYKKSLIYHIGLYPNSFKYAQDYAFFLKILKKYKIKIINKVLLKARIQHKESETTRAINSKVYFNDKIKLLKWAKKYLNPSSFEKCIINYKLFYTHLKKFISS